MAESLEIRVSLDGMVRFAETVSGAFVLGRQREISETPFQLHPSPDGMARIVIAEYTDVEISRTAARVVPLTNNRVRVENLSNTQPVFLEGQAIPVIAPHESSDLPLPVTLRIAVCHVQIQRPDSTPAPTAVAPFALAEETTMHSFAEQTAPPGRARLTRPMPGAVTTGGVAVVKWLQDLIDVFQSLTASDDFFRKAEQFVVDVAGMDTGRVFLRDAAGQWQPFMQRPHMPPPSRYVLERVSQDKKPFWSAPQELTAASLVAVHAVVAAPILDRSGDVVGVLYGDRRSAFRPVTAVEAGLVELVATAVAAGRARLEQERVAMAARAQFEQFFGPELAKVLTDDPTMLNGRRCEVTVLFADVRGFSSISEKLPPETTAAWMQGVLTELSDCVRGEQGVLIDYIGDELLALWGAPGAQPDHATRAAQAALAMVRRMPQIDARWRPEVGLPTRFGIGLHTGEAWVGEIGTSFKFKYGLLGHTVNLGSRIQGSTKYLRTPLLVSEHTRKRIGDQMPARRLTSVRVVNVTEPVSLYELVAEPPANWDYLRLGYEAALASYETGSPEGARAAVAQIEQLLLEFPSDGPAMALLGRATEKGASESEYDPVWELPGK